ncbi:zinc finger Y-chromosomal protein-like [Diadema setosum]|uniref:zinc finger Y-chromosomal protein-like n=1 Tax=Diadema setosum TaxID=31175 RepID=UPI003B3A1501
MSVHGLIGHMRTCDTTNPNSFSETLKATSLNVSKKRMKSHEHQSKPEGEGSKYSFGKREQCKVCGKSISKKNMHHHLKVHTGEKPFRCKVCSRCFSRSGHLKRHMSVHGPKHAYDTCNQDLFSLTMRAIQLKGHKRSFLREQCKVCGKSVLKHYMRVHMRVHTGEKPFQCKVCSRCFSHSGSLNRHMTLKHTYDDCNPESFSEAMSTSHFNALQKRMKLYKHQSKPQWQRHKHSFGREQCKVCGNSISKEYMRIHMRVHTGEKPFQCKVCSRCFTQKGSFKRHMRVHTGEKPFQCKVCSRCFSQNCSLTRHMSLHRPMHICDTTNPTSFSETMSTTSLDVSKG